MKLAMERTGLQQTSRGKMFFYFDSFAQPPPVEFVSYAKRIGKQIIFNSGHPIQELQSVRCGYYCLYFLNENQEKNHFMMS